MSSLLDSNCSRPHSETNSSAYNQLINGLVKPFKTEIDFKSIAFNDITIKKYICGQCFDEFLHESSLTTHLERRSVRISYLCDRCHTNLLFFNRCALLSHIRSHNQNSDQIDHKLSQVLVQPIDFNHLFSNIESKATKNSDNRSNDQKITIDVIHKTKTIDVIKCQTKCSTIGSISSSTNDVNSETKQKIFKIYRNEKKKTNNSSNDMINTKYIIKKSSNSELKCTECKSSFNSLWTREQHLTDKQLVLPLNQCRVCPTICATNCNQSFHNRLHSNCVETGIVCPECGSKLDPNNTNELLTHIIINCLHLSRRLTYNCMLCSVKMSSLSDSLQHIITDHTSQQFQCSNCQFISQSEDNLREHQMTNHLSISEPIVSVKCPICQTVINSRNNYSIHLTSHRKRFSDFTSFSFICLECDETFITKFDLKSHFNTFHIKDKNETQKNDYLKALTQRISVSFKLKINSISEKTSDKSKNETKNDFPNNLKVNETKSVWNFDDKNNSSNEFTAKRLKKISENDIKNQSSDQSRPQSGQQIATNDNCFECCECGLNFPVVQTLKRHLILEHRIHDVESYINKTYIKVAVVQNEVQLPKEVGEERLSKILDSKDSTDTLCPICSQKFSDSKELKIHGRVHGMAFIKSCQKKSL